MFNIVRFLENHNIPYRTSGSNVGRNEIAIKCPFCADDPSEHLGISLTTGYWNCLRASGHSGRRPQKLIKRLIGCSWEEADVIAASGGTSLDTFQETIKRLRDFHQPKQYESRSLRLPSDFRPLTTRGSGVYFTNYLIKRGFRERDLPLFHKNYDLHFCTTGTWRNRLIFPIWLEDQLVTWTGRAIGQRASPKYLTLGLEDSPKNSSLLGIKTTLWIYDQLALGGKALVLTEGPLDALKVDTYAKAYGVRATCLFGKGITEEQAQLISSLRNFKQIIILGDAGTVGNAWTLMSRLRILGPRIRALPPKIKDPGDMTPKQVEQMAGDL